MKPTIVPMEFKGIKLPVLIRKFDASVGLTREERLHHSEEGFNLAIVRKGVQDHQDIFRLTDKIGYSDQKSPKEIMAELAELVLEQNPHFRAFEPRNRPKIQEMGKLSEIAEKRRNGIEAIGVLEQKTLKSAKTAILKIWEKFSDPEIAEKLDCFEIGVETLRDRNWTFWDCLRIAERFDLDVKVVFEQFSNSRKGEGGP